MDWNEELASSLWWLLKTFLICAIVMVPVCWALVRGTLWGRQFWRLAGPFFAPGSGGGRALCALAAILFFTLAGVRLDVLFANWNNGIYTALQKLDARVFWVSMGVFGALASLHVVRSLLVAYLSQRFILGWRAWLNARLLAAWMQDHAYYRSLHLGESADNPDQRIQEDIGNFVETSLSLAMQTISSIVSIIAFTIMLWGLSGALAVWGLEVPRAMVFIVYIYFLVATVFAVKIGRPLVLLQFLAEKYAADYRYALVRLRENAESIAFYAGEKIEAAILTSRFGVLIANAWKILFRSLKFSGFNLAVSQVGVVFPMLLQAPRFFAQKITLGDMMQTVSAFGNVGDNLSFFRQTYDSFAGYRATLNRLSGFCDAIEAAGNLPRPLQGTVASGMMLRGLRVSTPGGRLLINDLHLTLKSGEALLVQGASGSGKTTLLRALAGIWPYCRGEVILPANGRLFLSQRPYLPLGTLREALCYPSSTVEAAWVAQTLAEVHLAHLVPRLDEAADWSRILSLGEQQRLAFARILLMNPAVVFLDEASSALDEGLEFSLYQLLRERLPECIVVSIGHRGTLLVHHTHRLEICGNGLSRFNPLT